MRARRKMVCGGPRQRWAEFSTGLHLAEVDATDSLRHLAGRAAPYGAWASRGWFLESFAESCFDKSLKESARGLPLLLWHDHESFPIGTASSWQSKSDGLWGQWRLDGSPQAQRAARLAKEGGLDGLSVGYLPLRSQWEYTPEEDYDPDDADTLDRCTRIEARLVETSLTPTPFFVDATVTHVADAGHARPHLDAWRVTLERLRQPA